MIIKIYDKFLQMLGLCRYGRYKTVEYHLENLRDTDQQKQIEKAWMGFSLFSDSINDQLKAIEKQKAIYFEEKCYRLVRDKSGDGKRQQRQLIPKNFLSPSLFTKFSVWLANHDDRASRGL